MSNISVIIHVKGKNDAKYRSSFLASQRSQIQHSLAINAGNLVVVEWLKVSDKCGCLCVLVLRAKTQNFHMYGISNLPRGLFSCGSQILNRTRPTEHTSSGLGRPISPRENVVPVRVTVADYRFNYRH